MSFAPVEEEVIVPLLAMESSKGLMEEPGVTSITCYRGDLTKATVYIRARVKAIVDANPWLAGRLVRDKQHKNVQLVHPQTPVSDDLIERLFHPNPCKLRIGSEMPYEELSKEATSAVVKKGRKLINRPDLVTRITIVPDTNRREEGFALIFSISHIAVDGQTYYQILNSLSTTGTIQPLRATRNHEASEKVAAAVGKNEHDFSFSVPMILNVMKGLIFAKKAKCFAFYVDPDKVKTAKSQVAANPPRRE